MNVMAQWLECGALLMTLPAVRLRTPFYAGYSENSEISCFSPLNIVTSLLCCSRASLDSAVNVYLIVQRFNAPKWLHDFRGIEMARTRTSRSSDQGLKWAVDKFSDLISYIKPARLPFSLVHSEPQLCLFYTIKVLNMTNC